MTDIVTGGTGFIGSALCRELVAAGRRVRVFDNDSRGDGGRLRDLGDRVEIVRGDVRDARAVREAIDGCEVVWHLAYINGTRFFYERPDDVLEVGIRGALNTLEASIDAGVRRYVLASTSETYNGPTHVPTTEEERLAIPDVTNPRFSYGGGKIASELLTLHLGGRRGLETVIFRPHNVYGPDMGMEHVVPEIAERIFRMSDGLERRHILLPIQGDGSQTRAFCYIDDAARGSLIAGDRGSPGQIYHLGTEEEVTIAALIALVAEALRVDVELVPGPLPEGGTSRRCPAIGKLRSLGYEPQVRLRDGVRRTVEWYVDRFRADA
jgi:nucleoside-diphosphate-sugar epimerase